MAGVIASRAAVRLQRPPLLVIGVETNLTRADAYFAGIAAQFDDARAFHASLGSRIRRMARRDKIVRGFASNLELADPMTLWTLGRSLFAQKDPGLAFRRLRSPRIYYWDAARASQATRDYIARFRLPQRRLDRLGHWPMIKSPGTFHAAVADDVRAMASG